MIAFVPPSVFAESWIKQEAPVYVQPVVVQTPQMRIAARVKQMQECFESIKERNQLDIYLREYIEEN